MKCFERLVIHNIKTSIPNTLDLLQFAYRPNRSTDDANSSTLHLALTHLENKDSYVRMLFIDFSSAFNTIIPQQLINKLSLLGLNNSLCNWILDFLTGRPQSVRVGHNTSSTTTLSTGAPQGCVLSPLLFTLLTHDCTAKFSSNHIIKFADDTSVVGLISNTDETHYREEVAQLAEWCGANNLSLNVEKTKEVVMDFRRNPVDHPPLTIDTSTVERVSSAKFLGVHITEDLTWTTNTKSISKKAQQRLHFLRRLKRASLPPPILTTFYRGTIESVLTSCITVWYGNCCAADRKTLQRTVNTAAKIIGAPLPSILDIFLTRCSSKAKSIVEDPTHPSHSLFQLLPSGRRYQSIRARSARLLNSFFPQAVRALNSNHTAPLWPYRNAGLGNFGPGGPLSCRVCSNPNQYGDWKSWLLHRCATIKGHSMCSFITQKNATDVTIFEGACNWHADCRNVHQSCWPWIECPFLYHKPSPKTFQRVWQYIQPASQPQTTCNHTSPGPPHPASSPPRSSETSHPDSCCNNRFCITK